MGNPGFKQAIADAKQMLADVWDRTKGNGQEWADAVASCASKHGSDAAQTAAEWLKTQSPYEKKRAL